MFGTSYTLFSRRCSKTANSASNIMQSEYHAMYNYIPAEKICEISYLRMYKTCDELQNFAFTVTTIDLVLIVYNSCTQRKGLDKTLCVCSDHGETMSGPKDVAFFELSCTRMLVHLCHSRVFLHAHVYVLCPSSFIVSRTVCLLFLSRSP